MELKFFSIEEVKDFVTQLKGTRGGKKDDGADAGTAQSGAQVGGTQPIMPPTGGPVNSPGFGTPTFAQPGGAFPATGAPQGGPDPATLQLVQRITNRIHWALQPAPQGGGQPHDKTLEWFRAQCGPEAANYTLEQIQQVALPRMSIPQLQQIAALMNA